MRRLLILMLFVLMCSFGVFGQDTATPTPTETPTATPTPTNEPSVYATIVLPDATPGDSGVTTRFDYVLTVGDVMTGFLLLALLISVWSMFIFAVVSNRGDEK